MSRKKQGDRASWERRTFFDVPALSYTGGKWQLAKWILSHFPPHEIYVEPYCGSAAIFLRKHRSKLEVINDMDADVVNFFDMLRSRPNDLMQAIQLTPFSRTEYERALNEPATDPLERARRFYVVLWQAFGSTAVYNSGWGCEYTTAQRSRQTDIWRRMDGLIDAAERLKDAQIDCRPATEVIEKYDSPHTLFYVDPPYVVNSRAGGKRRYRFEMSDDDHRDLASVLNNIQGMAILSGYDCELYQELYADWRRLEKTSTTNGNSDSVESLWLSPRTVSMNVLPLFKEQA